MSVKWEFDGTFWRFEPNAPDCEAAVFECRGKFHAVVNGWSPCSRVEEYLDPSPGMTELRKQLPEGAFGTAPKSREFETLEDAQLYCEQRLRESVMVSALALGLQMSSFTGTGTDTSVVWVDPLSTSLITP